ncbi:magnesium-translocating P-type ATPase [Actinomadura parmotrematis]|uniref:Magnesium-transporting ATPase, P-type 1 n=1 Tax=Actinomadura parmotrematis TaxID=2864039 RepID=A0ABS7FQA4_9ACTN|nr:magnesium-translocating P-type ATPase [Actinomadura parmotrematis]MBW8482410.1 magnesium-translocating P-type ATPase [Actinomadura parmotrematis]
MVSAPEGIAGDLAEHAAQPPLALLRRWETSPRGLDEAEAERRQLAEAPPPARRRRRLSGTAAAPFVLVLAALGAVSALVGDLRGAALIGLLAVISGALRFGQERRTGRAAAELRALAGGTATVLRRAAAGGPSTPREVPAEQVVRGDLVVLHPGDVVPADLRLLASADLTVDQAVLTGESHPAGKHAAWTDPSGDRDAPADPFDDPRLCFAGTTVAGGTGTAVALATGAATYVGAAGRALPGAAPATTFDRGVRSLSWALAAVMLAAAPAALAVTGGLDGAPGGWPGALARALPLAVAVAVAATPEMLPLVVTALLVRGSAGLARRQVIVRRLPAVHNLGAMDTLCLDKTGTLTAERLSLDCHLDARGRPSAEVLRLARLNAHWSVELSGRLVGDAIDGALLEGADGDPTGPEGTAALPFDYARRRATVVLGGRLLVTKGAVEDVLARCALDAAERARLTALADRWAAGGVRLLAVATAERRLARALSAADERDLRFAGFVGFRDRLVPVAAPALADLARLGVRPVMVTGDHPLVARRICRDAGLPAARVVHGGELAALDDARIAALAAGGAAFARVGPAGKARIVRALRASGRTVGYLGDGVNDVPALRAADVGISVTGAAGPAREAAGVVLAHRDLRVLAEAVRTGRRTFAGTVRYLKIALTSNVGNVASMLAAAALLPFLPMLPLQVLVQNMCFDVAQLALVRDRVDEGDLAAPRTFDRRDLARFVACFGPIGAVFDLAAFGLFWLVLHVHGDVAGQALFHTGWFAENLLAMGVALLLLRGRGRGAPRPPWPVVAAAAALALTGLLVPFSPLAGLLGLRALPLAALPLLAAALAGYVLATLAARRLYQRAFGRWL